MYDDMHLDALKELSNIGGGNAATALSSFSGTPVDMGVPQVDFLEYEELYDQGISAEEEVMAITLNALGDMVGMFLFTTRRAVAENMVRTIAGDQGDLNTELGKSVLKETMNIFVSSYLSALSTFLGMNIFSSVPTLQEDFFGAVVSSAYMEMGQFEETSLLIRDDFTFGDQEMESMLFFIPMPGELQKLLGAMGMDNKS